MTQSTKAATVPHYHPVEDIHEDGDDCPVCAVTECRCWQGADQCARCDSLTEAEREYRVRFPPPPPAPMGKLLECPTCRIWTSEPHVCDQDRSQGFYRASVSIWHSGWVGPYVAPELGRAAAEDRAAIAELAEATYLQPVMEAWVDAETFAVWEDLAEELAYEARIELGGGAE